VQSNETAYQIAQFALAFGSLSLWAYGFRVRLIPRAFAGWALLGYVCLLTGVIAELFGVHIGTMLLIPGGLIGLALSILAGRLSDRVGRKPMAFTIVALAGVCFFLFYNGVPGWAIPPLWIMAFFCFFSGDVLVAGFALEIVPTQYRATVSGLRYLVEIGFGAVSLALEGVLYDQLGSHGAAIQCLLAAIPITLLAILFLPEPAGRTLEEMAS
jgi:MFS family permease